MQQDCTYAVGLHNKSCAAQLQTRSRPAYVQQGSIYATGLHICSRAAYGQQGCILAVGLHIYICSRAAGLHVCSTPAFISQVCTYAAELHIRSRVEFWRWTDLALDRFSVGRIGVGQIKRWVDLALGCIYAAGLHVCSRAACMQHGCIYAGLHECSRTAYMQHSCMYARGLHICSRTAHMQ